MTTKDPQVAAIVWSPHIMAGVVAMASVIEDFDTQPCKKSRKDGGSPVVKTITNYFSPVPKPAEKPLSPPRSSKILDFFSQKASSSKVKSRPLQDFQENHQKPQPEQKRSNTEVEKKHSEKRGRKTSRTARKLVPAEVVDSNDDMSCLIVEETQESKVSDAVGHCETLGSDTAALLLKFTAGTCESEMCKNVSKEKTESDSTQASDPKSENGENTTASSPIAEVKQVRKVARKPTKRQQKETKHPELEVKEANSSLCDVGLDESSELNSSTVTISFEDFVRNQSHDRDIKDDQGEEHGGKNTEKAEELNREQLGIPNTEERVVPVQVSPRTLTVQAEVHAVSPEHKTAKAAGKLASIFTRKKVAVSAAEPAASPAADGERQLPSTSSTVKRRSNVVLLEEDLELAVIESESTPKCSEVERKQFMAAFKQPSLDGSKAKPLKSQSKQKQAEENTVEAAEDGDVPVPSVEQGVRETKASVKGSVKTGRNKAKPEALNTSPAASAVKETEVTAVDVDHKNDQPPITLTSKAPALRRSRRQTAEIKSPEKTLATPVRKTRRRKESKEMAKAASPQLSPAEASTPESRRSRHGVFVAEIVCPPDANESPIRIRLSRVHKKTESGNDMAASSNNKILNESKKRKQAKKLVEKAKMIQQSKKTTAKETLRRSSRTKTSAKTSYCEDEDSVVCIEDLATTPQNAPEETKTQKTFRCLNEVLGKASPAGKNTKAIPGPIATSLGQSKSVRKPSAVISIFDDGSREGSENSEDDEQFRARREFLKSGLPESFRKQIAKTAATKEAYSASSLSSQPVSHTTQAPADCSLWSLPWPETSFLGHLKNIWSFTPNPPPSISGSLCVKTESASRTAFEMGSVWTPKISEDDRQVLMKDLCSRNPHFPAQTVFTRLQKRRADHQQQRTASDAVSEDDSCVLLPDKTVGGKRKRKEDEREINMKVAKKQKSVRTEENTSAEQEPPRRGGRTRRAQKSRVKEEEDETKQKTKLELKSAPVPSEDDSVIVVDDLTLEADTRRKESMKEEFLWTDKYQPQISADIIDNSPAVNRLHSWLKDWKLRADRDERKNQSDKNREEGSYDSEWDCGEEDCQDTEDTLCNTMLITGPTGVGKTAAVYACAQELGFKVFEVNASSQRSGRLILSQLKEATQSHQVDSQGVNSHKPSYFNSYGLSSSSSSVRPGSSPRKVNSPRRVVSSPRKNPQSPRGPKKGGLAPTSLAKFFKMAPPANKETQKHKQTASSTKANVVIDKNNKLVAKSPATSTPKEKSVEEQSKKTATSLILFEEVDVIFDDDSGFLAAIKIFMSTTKRPVILTTSDPAFSAMFDGNFEEIHFKKPSAVNVSSYLQLLCLAEDMRTHPPDVGSLLKLNGCDIRQSLLQLQFWAQSAGERPFPTPMVPTVQNGEPKPENKEAAEKSVAVSSGLPPCHSGCKLGLLNVESDRDVWELLRSRRLVEATACWELLADGRQRGVDLLYSNMENLLQLPLTTLSTSKPYKHKPRHSESHNLPAASPAQQPSSTSFRSDTQPPGDGVWHAAESTDPSDGCSPLKVSSRMKKNKRRHHLPNRGGLNSESDSEDGFQALCKRRNNCQTEDIKERGVCERVRRTPLTAEEKIKSAPVSQCLRSIADFWDDMSYVDSSLRFHQDTLSDNRRSPVSAVFKDGMTDELRIDSGRGSWSTRSRVDEIQAAVEVLSFHVCRASVAEAWDKVQQLEGDLRTEAAEELTLPVATHREEYSFAQEGLGHPQSAQKRREVIENLFIKVFGTLGNRQAAARDYLPAMRAICRSELLKEQGKVKRRFLHYLDAIHLGLEKNTLQFLAEDFP